MEPHFTVDGDAVRQIRTAAARGTLSHALLLTGGGNLPELARYAAAAYECTAADGRPCGTCPDCRKVLRDIHPDVVTVRDDEHKFISADVVRDTRSNAWIRPNEGARKVYIFPDCSLLTAQDQNILLKVVEEGPPYAAFLFCAENVSGVLRTLRSRCVELKCQGTPEASRGIAAERGAELCQRVVRGRGAVAEFCTRLESAKKKLTREDLQELLAWCREAFAAALFLTYGREAPEAFRPVARHLIEHLDRKRIAAALDKIGAYYRDCDTAVGVGHVLGALAADLEGL
ncbi:MAG: DNA polymerase III subunit delta' [Oscillospiraceae bacterium]|nr:DNA polymerase III subunit delta' [Oscillospiraceae bacterium]